MLTNSLWRVTKELNALARSSTPEGESWQNVRRSILEAATLLRLETKQTALPITLNKIAAARKIRRIESFRDSNAPEAVLVPIFEGFVLKLRDAHSKTRRRFNIAHEIGHTFFYDLEHRPPTRLLVRSSSKGSYKEEDICSAFARELLMPQELVITEQRKVQHDNNLNLLVKLAGEFEVSTEVATIRLLRDLSEFGTTAVFFRDIGINKETGSACIRAYFGKNLVHKRKGEKELLSHVNEIIGIMSSRNYLTEKLEEIRLRNVDILSIHWAIGMAEKFPSITVLITFYRDKKPGTT